MLKRFVEDLAKYSLSQFLPAITAFITTPILTRLFLPVEYGYWALAANISAFLVALAASGYGSAILRYYPIYKANSSLDVFYGTLTASVFVIICLSTIMSILILSLFKTFIPLTLYQLLPLAVAIFVAQSIFTIFMSLLRAQQRSGSFTTFQLTTNYAGLGIGLLLVIAFGFRIEGLLWGTLVTTVILLPLIIYLAVRGIGIKVRRFHLADAWQIWDFAWPLTLGNVAMWGLRVSDLYIIRIFRSEQDVGLYSVSYNISAKSIELLVALFLLSVSPLIFGTWENKGLESTEQALTMVTRIYFLLCLPAAIGLSVLAFPFVELLTTPNYYEGYHIVGFIVFSSFVWGLSNIAMMGIAIKKKAQRLAVNQIVAASTHIVLQLIFVPKFGYIASAVSTLIGYSVLLTLQALSSRPYITWRLPFDTIGKVIASSAIMGVTAWVAFRLCNLITTSLIASLFLSIVAAIVIYISCLLVLGEVRANERQAVLQIWQNSVRGLHG